MPRNTSVTLGDHFEQFVAEIVQQGRYQSVSEVVRAGLRKLEADEVRLQALRARLQAGEDGLVAADFDGEQFIATLHNKHIP
jgi:antitoxin ParD1/3/4